jgi:hypothetical protein
VPPPYPFLPSNRAYYDFALAFAVLGVGFCARLLTSVFGRAIDSIREGERLAECSGVPVIRFKVTVFVIACALAGMAGSLHGHYIKFVGPDAYSGFQSLNLVVMNVIGGCRAWPARCSAPSSGDPAELLLTTSTCSRSCSASSSSPPWPSAGRPDRPPPPAAVGQPTCRPWWRLAHNRTWRRAAASDAGARNAPAFGRS